MCYYKISFISNVPGDSQGVVVGPKLAAYCTAYCAYCEHVAVSANRAIVCGLNGAVSIH